MIVMTPLISSIEDDATVLYRGRAVLSALSDNSAMKNGTWKSRLEDAVANSGKSKRAISLDAGYGPGYLHSILAEGKDPTVEKLMAICDKIPVSGIHVLYGVDINPDDLEILKELEQKPNSRAGILSIIRNAAS